MALHCVGMLGDQMTIGFPTRRIGPHLLPIVVAHMAAMPTASFIISHNDDTPIDMAAADALRDVAGGLNTDLAIYATTARGAAQNRARILDEAPTRWVAMIDDDAVPDPWDWPLTLAAYADKNDLPWVVPIIRFREGLWDRQHRVGPPDIWRTLTRMDEFMLHGVEEKYGTSALRIYDVAGAAVRGTALLGGTAFVVDMAKVEGWMIRRLRQWPPRTGDEDMALGNWLGVGGVANSARVYHYGVWADGDWDEAPLSLVEDDLGRIHDDVLQWRDALRKDRDVQE